MNNRIHIIARNPGLPPSPEQPGPLPPRPEEPIPPTPNPDLPNLPPAEPEEPRLPPADPDPSSFPLPDPEPGWSAYAAAPRIFLIEGHGIRSSIRIF